MTLPKLEKDGWPTAAQEAAGCRPRFDTFIAELDGKVVGFALYFHNYVSKNDEFCIKNEEFCIKNEGSCIKNEELCIKNDELCRVPGRASAYTLRTYTSSPV